MAFDPRISTVGSYGPKKWRIECFRCHRGVELDGHNMQKRFGKDMTLAECARHVAAGAGCNLAAMHDGPGCSVQVFETKVWTWASLIDARLGNWQAYLTCQRRFASMKATKGCPETIQLDVLSLISVLGDDFTLDKLRGKLHCPLCGTASVDVEWFVPEPPKAPAPVMERPHEPISLRPRGADRARTKLGVVQGDRR